MEMRRGREEKFAGAGRIRPAPLVGHVLPLSSRESLGEETGR